MHARAGGIGMCMVIEFCFSNQTIIITIIIIINIVHHKINHSCEPNAEVIISSSFDTVRIVVRATRAIAANSQIFIAYTAQAEQMEDVHARFWRLLWDYDFECDCEKCQREIQQ